MDALKSKGQMFDQINLGDVSRSGFDRTFNFKGTGTLGRLYPVRCEETLPGDRWQGSSTATVQFQPLAVPMMSNMYTRIETFKVPSRLVWKNWEKFITGGEKLNDLSKLPTTSLKKIVKVIENQIISTAFPIKKGMIHVKHNDDGTYSQVGLNVYISKSQWKTFLSDILSSLNSNAYLEDNQMVDLFQQTKEVIENMYRNIDTYFETTYTWALNDAKNSVVMPIFEFTHVGSAKVELVKVSHPDPKKFLDKDAANFFDGLTPLDTYTKKEIIPVDYNFELKAILDKVDELDSISYDLRYFLDEYVRELGGTLAPYFSTEFVRLLNDFYDAISPLYGVGSVLDYLSCGIISPKDWFVHAYTACYSSMYYSAGSSTLHFPNLKFGLTQTMSSVSDTPISILPLRALYLIWYNYYRDQLLETDAFEPSDDDVVTDNELLSLVVPRYRCWSKDTFTTALTNTGTGTMIVPTSNVVSESRVRYTPASGDNLPNEVKLQGLDVHKYTMTDGTVIELPTRYLSGLSSEETAHTGSTAGFSLDMLNRAQRMQKWLQKALIYGNRPQDAYWTHFRVKSSDARLFLPEYISGESSLVRLDTITNNTNVGAATMGDKAANAYGYFDGMNMNVFCEEHGFIISLFSVMPELSYGFGLDRKFVRTDKFDYAWPEFAQLGMDAVYNRELLQAGIDLSQYSTPQIINLYSRPNSVFGYQGRYYDYKSKQDEIHGELLTTMDVYTFARKFTAYGGAEHNQFPNLNYQFVHCHPRLDMFVNDSFGAPVFWFDIHHAQAVERALPVPSMTV